MKTALLVGATVVGGVGAGFVVERTGVVGPIPESSTVASLVEVLDCECPDQVVPGDRTIEPFGVSTVSRGDVPVSPTPTARDTLSISTSLSSGTTIPLLLHDCGVEG